MEPSAAPEPSALRSYLAVLRRRWLVVVLVTAVVTVTAFTASARQDPVYEATAQVLLQPRLSEEVLRNPVAASQTPGDSDTELEIMQSRSIEDPVAAALGHEPDVRLSRIPDTAVVDITASSHRPEGAATDATTFANVYAATRRDQTTTDLQNAAVELQARIADIDAQLQALPQPDEGETDPARTALETRRSAYADQLDSLQLATNLTVTGGAQVVSEAREPTDPVEPQPVRVGLIALGIGLILGIALAFTFEQLNDRVRSKDELEAASGLPTVGLIPSVSRWRKRSRRPIVAAAADTSTAGEAFRSLRTAVQFLGIERGAEVIQITSSLSAEGKTTIAANLGMALARAGKRVIVVDSDLRRPRLHELFGMVKDPGLSSVLVDESTLEVAIRRVSDDPCLAVLPSGQVPPNPSDLLVLTGYAELVDALKSVYDHVIIDTPPVLPVTDALIVAALADVTLLVTASRSARQKDVRRAVELLRQVDAPLVGAVLNKVPSSGRSGYSYFSGYNYQPTHAGRTGWWRRARNLAPPPARADGSDEDARASL
jgi:non-specific protein-tyrosine kinase